MSGQGIGQILVYAAVLLVVGCAVALILPIPRPPKSPKAPLVASPAA